MFELLPRQNIRYFQVDIRELFLIKDKFEWERA